MATRSGLRAQEAGGRRARCRPAPIVSNGRQLAALGHAEALLRDLGLVGEVAAAARLAIENEQLEAEVRAQLVEFRRSRARIGEASDQNFPEAHSCRDARLSS